MLRVSGAPLEGVRRVHPHPQIFSSGCGAPLLKDYNQLYWCPSYKKRTFTYLKKLENMSLDKVADKFVAEYEKRRADLGPKT